MKQRLKLIIKYAKPHKLKFALLLFCIISTCFIGALYPYIFGKLVDEVFYNKNIKVFIYIVITYGIIFCISQILHFILNMSWANLMTRFLFDIRRALFCKMLSLKGRDLSSMRTGDIINRINYDSEQFMNFIHWNIFYSLGIMIDTMLSISIIAYLNWRLAIISLIIVPIEVVLSKHFSTKAKKIYSKMLEKNGVLYSWVYEMLKGITDIKLLRAGKRVLSQFASGTVHIYRLKIDAIKVNVKADRINNGITLLGTLCVYSLSAYFIFKDQLTVGGFIACADYFKKLYGNINALSTKTLGIAENMAGIDRVAEILNSESEKYNEALPEIDISKGNIKFCDVKFTYDNEIPVLKGINFEIKQGERIALVGRSGAGKSTIANLMYKLYEIDSGEILIDGINIYDCDLHSLRKQIGIVHQDLLLFDGSLRYNLIFSDNKDHDSKIILALEAAHLGEFIKGLPNGLDTKLGLNGQGLSGGQKQRLAIARIFLKNPKILIFDEATSSLDSEAEAAIKLAWDTLCTDRTIIIIAHRASTIINSDKICVIDNGYIAGFDTHRNLLDSCDIYNKLFHEQYRSEEEVIYA